MTTTLVLPERMANSLRDLTHLAVETGAVLLARPVTSTNGDLRLLGKELHPVPEIAYELREYDVLRITSDGYVPAIGLAEELGCVPIWLHTHPGDDASPRPSRYDLKVDEQLSDLFRLRSSSPYYGSLILSHEDGALEFTGILFVFGFVHN